MAEVPKPQPPPPPEVFDKDVMHGTVNNIIYLKYQYVTRLLKYVTIATRHTLYLINKVYTSKPSN